MGKGRLVTVKGHHASGDHHLDARLRVHNPFQPQSVQHCVVLLFQGGALQGGQDAGDVKGVRLLPCGHRIAGATAKGAVDGSFVEAGPFQHHLQFHPLVAGQQLFAAAGFGRGFIRWFGFGQGGRFGGGFCCGVRRRLGGGLGGCNLRIRLRRGVRCHTFGRINHATIQHVGPQRPELLPVIRGFGDIRIARDQPVGAIDAQHLFGIIAGVRSKSDAVPAATQGKAVHILDGAGMGAVCRGGQTGVRFDLHPNDLLRGLSRRRCRHHSCCQP